MKKSLVLLAGIGMAFIGLPAVTHAQAASGPFADVPTDHWAYASVDTLQRPASLSVIPTAPTVAAAR